MNRLAEYRAAVTEAKTAVDARMFDYARIRIDDYPDHATWKAADDAAYKAVTDAWRERDIAETVAAIGLARHCKGQYRQLLPYPAMRTELIRDVQASIQAKREATS